VRVTFCGTRGSTPAPGPDYVRFGGHTSCVALSHDDAAGSSTGISTQPTLLLDAGTGLRRLPGLLGDLPFRGTILLTHLHWDHVQGLPFFRSGDRDDARVSVLLPTQGDSTDMEEVLERMMSPPFFPITPSQLRGDWRFGPIPGDAFTAEGFSVVAIDVPHKGGHTVGFRVSDGRSSVAYIPDHCPTALGPGPGGIGEYHDAALDLARDADLLIHDAHLRAEEVEAEGSFGHAAAEYAVRLGTMAGARRVALFHHRPERSDAEVERTLCRFAESPVPVIAAAETLTLEL
jgi:phosphoribosyl 1,2-cyclic phosphodiesterase